MRNFIRKLTRGSVFALLMVIILAATGCGRSIGGDKQRILPEGASEFASFDSAVNLIDDEAQGARSEAPPDEVTTPEAEPDTEPDTAPDIASDTAPDTVLAEDGSYSSKDEVALYLHTYGKLPSNFITKKEAKKLGWTGGSVEDYAPGKAIGGDYFGNYEGLLPEDKEYHECDIDTLGKNSRGAKRIIYSDDGYIYYTGDHYESFELLYEGD